MAKGNIAKQNVAKKIAEVFGSDFVGEFDKKLYLWSEENGEKVQIAISMTCPKNPIESGNLINYQAEPGNRLNFEDSTPVVQEKKEITEDEKKHIADLMAKLGL